MQKTITIKEATNWITKMAAKDGVISTNERKLLKEFYCCPIKNDTA